MVWNARLPIPLRPDSFKCEKIDETSEQCMLKKCSDDEWQDVRICQFGFDIEAGRCVNPCDICVSPDKVCPTTIYDKQAHTMYQCSQETGWNIGVCTNDFSEDSTLSFKDNIDINQFVDKELEQQGNLQLSSLVYGKCGECSEENSPSFCSGDKRYIHHCKNGKYIIFHCKS